MDDTQAMQIWQQIVAEFEDKLQFGFLEQVKYVTGITISGSEICISVNNEEAADFFNSPVNETRLIVTSRPFVRLDKLTVRFEDTDI